MRTLGKLKLIAVSAALVLGMSSCLKNDKKFAIYASPAYILKGTAISCKFKCREMNK